MILYSLFRSLYIYGRKFPLFWKKNSIFILFHTESIHVACPGSLSLTDTVCKRIAYRNLPIRLRIGKSLSSPSCTEAEGPSFKSVWLWLLCLNTGSKNRSVLDFSVISVLVLNNTFKKFVSEANPSTFLWQRYFKKYFTAPDKTNTAAWDQLQRQSFSSEINTIFTLGSCNFKGQRGVDLCGFASSFITFQGQIYMVACLETCCC